MDAMHARISLRKPDGNDLPAIARLFVETFGGHPIASLPARLQHRFIAAHTEEGLTLLAVDGESGRVVGFAIGGRREDLDRARRRFIYRNAPALLYHALSPRGAALRVARAASRRDHSSPHAAYELRYLAVAADERGRRIGSALLAALESGIFAQRPYFVWVLAERPAALQFYARHGFDREHHIDGHVRLIKRPGRGALAPE
jgi:ribosomal protein S18 acetylase RimI-like enzyme